jgi:Carboxypeptidase regulatory-like domain
MREVLRRYAILAAAGAALLILPVGSLAQTTGAISARAQDASGALIPGVEVAVSSPAMISGSRTALTDEQGAHRFTELVPGTYRVSFMLAGFKTLNIDGVEVTAGTTRTIMGSLEVATASEEITVTSQAPTIDLEAATVGVNWGLKKLDDLPYARSIKSLTTMIPGLYQTSYDVGGSSFGSGAGISARTYGKSGGTQISFDGILWSGTYADYGAFEEVNLSTASKSADQVAPGASFVAVLKSGSNSFHGNVSMDYERGGFQSNNVDQDLIDRGYVVGNNKFTKYRNVFGDIGGRIIKDKLWFYGAFTHGYQGTFIPGFIELKTGEQHEYFTKIIDPTAKLTYQITPSQKVDAFWTLNRKWQAYRNASNLVPLEATQNQDAYSTIGPSARWTWIVNPKMTATAQIARGGWWWPMKGWSKDVRKTDTTTGATIGSFSEAYSRAINWNWTVDVSRVGTIGGRTHELKFGYFGQWHKNYQINFGYPNEEVYQYKSLKTDTCPNNIVCDTFFTRPDSVVVWDYPNTVSSGDRWKGFYVNDKVTVNRNLTINLGIRLDHYSTFLPEQGNPGTGPYAVRRIFPSVSDSSFPIYTRWSPRLSLAYDVTGTGRVAVKASWGRYSNGAGPGSETSGVNPNSARSCTYNKWDGTIPYTPDFGPDGLMGTADDINLARACTGGVGTYNFDSNLQTGYMDEYAAGVDVGLSHDYTLRVNVVRKFDFGGSKTVDVLLPYDAYTDVRSGVDPGRDGITGTADDGEVFAWSIPASNPNRTTIDRLFTNYDLSKNEGGNSYTAYEVTFNKAFSDKWSLLTAYTLDLGHVNNAFPLNPNQAYYNWQLPVWSNSFKMNGTYELPYGLIYAATLTTQSGDWYNRTAQVRNALNSTVSQVVEGQFFRRDRVTLWDNRIGKKFQTGDWSTLEISGDLYNTLNTNAVTNLSTNSSSSSFLKPTAIIPARIFKLGFRWRF